MKVSEVLKDERIENIKYVTVFTKDNKLVKDIRVSYDIDKIKEALKPYLNNDCEFWQEDHNDGYCDTGYISWSFWELHIYTENNNMNYLKKFIKEIYPEQETISWQQLSISCDSYGSHDVYIGIYKNHITYTFWNPTDDVINIVKDIIKNKGELHIYE